MANTIKKGESLFIPFRNGESIYDSQLKPRMYKTKEQYDRFSYLSDYAEMVEYVEVVRCKDCKHYYHSMYSDRDGRCSQFGTYDTDPSVYLDDFCSYGERRTDG